MGNYKTLLTPFVARAASGLSAFLVTYGIENGQAEAIAGGVVAAICVGIDLILDRKAK